MSTVSILCMTCCDRLNVCADDVDYAAKRVEAMAKERDWIRVERDIEGRKHTADVCAACASIIHGAWERVVAGELSAMKARATEHMNRETRLTDEEAAALASALAPVPHVGDSGGGT